MDPLDMASELALTYQQGEHVLAISALPPLTHHQLNQLAEHLVGSDMAVTTALRAMPWPHASLSLDDIDGLAQRIEMCDRCGTWKYIATCSHICEDGEEGACDD